MSEITSTANNTMRLHSVTGLAVRAANVLRFGAAPTFALMALLTGAHGEPDALCMAAQDASLLSGMVLMYLLMSAFHLAPWLRLIAHTRSNKHRVRSVVLF